MDKDDLIEEHRQINIDESDYWADGVLDDFIYTMWRKGIDVEKENIGWDVSFCQGSGACFSCDINDKELFDKFCRTHNLYVDYPILERALTAGCEPWFKCERSTSSRYNHSSSMTVTFSNDMSFYDLIPREDYEEGYYEEKPNVRYATAKALQDQLEDIQTYDFEKEIAHILQGYADDLHQKLEYEYSTLTDDDAVWDTIVEYGYDTDLDEDVA
ncbi:MAG: hypothetical protein ACXADS_15305 [Candidatus Thorarchaeota archaeon]|jgi:hypothetical protein